jgi:hypothetical protein
MPTRKEQEIQEEEEEGRLTSQELLQKEHQQAIDRSSHKNKKKNSGKTTDEARRGISHCSDIVKLLSNPVDLGGPVAGNIAVGQNPDGRLQIFARLPNGNIFTDWQDHGGNWSSTGGADLGGSIAGDISVGINTTADGGLGRLQIFARGLQNQIITTAQREPGSALFDPLVDLGFNIEGNIAVGQNPDGRLQIFARLPNGNIFTDWQNKPDLPYDWSSTGGADLGGSIAGDICVRHYFPTFDHFSLQIFARGLQNQIITTAQREPGSALFDPLVDLGFNIEGNIALWTPPWSPIPVPPPAAASSQIFVKENSRIVSYGLI